MTQRRLSPRTALLCTTALQAVAWLGLSGSAAAQPAPLARPQGGQVVAGTAAIAQTPNVTAVTQTSNRAAIDWRSFDVGSGHSVNFAQPSASSVTLNRVTGPDPSAIAGQINANGQIIITNGSGVMFHQGAQVNAQSLVVSAAGISNKNFMAGRMAFDQAPRPDARVENRGTITVKQAGLAALVAPSVANSGVINARLGQVVLAGARTHTLDMYGDGLVAIDVTGQVRETPRGPDGAPVTALVTNTGVIRADGGVIQLTAAAADGVVSTLVRAGGRVRANTVGDRTGRIEITGTGGAVVVEGRISADGRGPGERGGEVLAMADGITGVTGGAHISANGRGGGGTIAIGTTLARARGTGVAPPGTSARVIVGAGALINADGLGTGSGGRVTVLSTQDTRIGGTLTARGGQLGGDGGTVEMSGAIGFSLTGTADTSAQHGRLGSIVLDPYDLNIAATGPNIITLSPGDPSLAFSAGGGPGTTNTVTPAAILALNGNVHLQTVHNLTVIDGFTINADLNLEAGNNLTVAQGAQITSTGGNVVLTAASPAITGFDPAGAISVQGGVTATSATLTLNAGTGGIALGGAISAQSLVINTPGALVQAGGSVTTTSNVYGTAGDVSLTSAANSIPTVAAANFNGRTFKVTGPAGDFRLVSSVPVTVGDSSGGGISVQTGRTISLTVPGLAIAGGQLGPTGGLGLYAPAGTIALQPFAAGQRTEIVAGTKTPGSLSLTLGEFARTRAATLMLGGIPGAPSTGAINLGNAGEFIDLTANGGYTTLALNTTGAVTQGGSLRVPAVTGQSQTLALGDANNSIQTLAGYTTTGGDLLFRTSSTSGLTVNGLVVANNGASNVTIASSGFNQTLTLAADIRGRTVTIDSSSGQISPGGGINQTAGIITADTIILRGVSASLPDQNQVANLGASTIDTTLLFTDARALAITGDVTATTSLTLTAPTITQDPATTIATAALSGSAVNASFDSPTNAIGEVVNFSTPNGVFSLTDLAVLNIGSINADGGQIALTADLTRLQSAASVISAIGGSVRLAPLTPGYRMRLIAGPGTGELALSLTQPFINAITTNTIIIGGPGVSGAIDIGNPGDAITLAGHATTLQFQTTGAVTEAAGASLTVADLVGTSGSLALTGANTIGSIGLGNAAPGTLTGYTTAGDLALTTATSLSVNNTVSAGGALSLTTTGGGITQAGGLIATPGMLTLSAFGAITQAAGRITAGLLTGNAASVSLSSQANQIATLGPFTTTGPFALTDGTSLTVVGSLDPPDVTLNVTGDLVIASTIFGGTVTLNATGAITETATGEVGANTLTGNARSAAFTQRNLVGTLGAFATQQGFSLNNDQPLTVAGPVTDTVSIALQSAGTMTLTGTVKAPAISLVATDRVIRGQIRTPGDILQTGGTVTAANTLFMSATGIINQTGGQLVGGTLSGNSGGTTTLTGANNFIAALGPFTSTGGFALTDGGSLVVTGPVTDSASIALAITGDLSLASVLTAPVLTTTATGAITQPGGSLHVGTLTGSAASANFGQGGNAVGGLGAFTTTGGFALADGVPLTVAGAVTAGDGRSITITDSAPTFGAAGSLTAANGRVVLQSNGAISVGAATGTGGAPPVTANTLTIASLGGGPVAINGDLTLPNVGTLDLETSGAITQTGAITVAALTGRGGSATLTGANRILALNGFDVGAGTFVLADAGPLTITGTVRASQLQITSVGRLTLSGGAIVTDTGSLQVTQGAGGAQFAQTGTTAVAPLSGASASLRIGVADGTLALNNLVAPSIGLTISLGRGSATGNLQAGSFQVEGAGGSANLFGTVGGQGGFPAAIASKIQPRFDTGYLLNNCAIASITCTPIVLPPPAIQIVNSLISPGAFLWPPFHDTEGLDLTVARDRDDPSLLLPNISDRDY